jgi:hypothetical protein
MRFILIHPIHLSVSDSIPTGSTGHISRYDTYHLMLTFDVVHKCLNYWDNTLILDIYDTDEEIWTAIGPELALSFDDGDQKCEKPTQGTTCVNYT